MFEQVRFKQVQSHISEEGILESKQNTQINL